MNTRHIPIVQRLFSIISVTLALLLFSAVHAESPVTKSHASGYYRMMLGDFEVTALLDGVNNLDLKRLTNAKQEDIRQLLAQHAIYTSTMPTAVNAYLINTGRHLVLVDTGGGTRYGPKLGNVMRNLRAAGYRPEQVDTIILTHMHSDHIGGLLDANAYPAFPSANVLVAKDESDFWLSHKIADSSPQDWQRIFVAAQQVSSPYLSRGRWQTFQNGAQLVPGIWSIVATGHTPGHTAFSVESRGQRLLIWGDIVHNEAVQFARPDVGFDFDVSPNQAITTRKTLLHAVAKSGELVAGMHLPFPGIGRVKSEGKGVYRWIPVKDTPEP